MEFDVIVVGSGFSGSVFARELAEHNRQKVLLIEERRHIGGNMYDERDENGILVQRYGPHYINTNKYWIVKYLEQFAELVTHNLKTYSYVDGEYLRLPFNFETVQQITPPEQAEKLLALFREAFTGRDRVPIFELLEHKNEDIRAYGELLYEKAFKTYTAKQWGLDPSEMSRSVYDRIPIAMNYDERYINKDFQRLPKHGFTKLFENMLNHPSIEIRTGTNALDSIILDEVSGIALYEGKLYKTIIYTGAIDELFGERFGRLPYRSLDIRYRVEKTESALPAEIISYPQAEGYTRSTEFRKLCHYPLNTPNTVVATEYPLAYDKDAAVGNLPYYPVINAPNLALYEKYLKESQKYDNLLLCGRLAEYRYYNMDQAIESAFEKLEVLRKKLNLQTI